MSERLRIGVLGCGAIARDVHLRALRRLPGATVAAIADEDAAALAAASRVAPGARRCRTLEEMLEGVSPDAVIVCTPSGTHAAHAEQVLRAGKALYLEKPVASELGDAEQLVALSEMTAAVAVAGFNRRFHPLFRDLHRVMLSGAIGRPRLIRTSFSEPVDLDHLPVWKRTRSTGGGVLLDLASHHLDLVRWLTSAEPHCVSATVSSVRTEHDEATILLSLPGGARVEMFVSFLAARMDAVEVVGERGVARTDRYARTMLTTVTSTGSHSSRRIYRVPSARTAIFRALSAARPAWEPSYRSALASFVRAARGGAEPDLASLADGLRSLALVVAAEEAARNGSAPVIG